MASVRLNAVLIEVNQKTDHTFYVFIDNLVSITIFLREKQQEQAMIAKFKKNPCKSKIGVSCP